MKFNFKIKGNKMEKVKLHYCYLNEQELELLKKFCQLAGHIENSDMKNEEIISMSESTYFIANM